MNLAGFKTEHKTLTRFTGPVKITKIVTDPKKPAKFVKELQDKQLKALARAERKRKEQIAEIKLRNFMRYGTLDDTHESDDDQEDEKGEEKAVGEQGQGGNQQHEQESLRQLLESAEQRMRNRREQEPGSRRGYKQGRRGIVSEHEIEEGKEQAFWGEDHQRESYDKAIKAQREYLLGEEGKGGLPVVEAGGVRSAVLTPPHHTKA